MHKNDDEYKRYVKLVKQFENLKARHNCGGGGIGQLLRVPSPPESRGAQILSKREFYNKFPFRLVRMSFSSALNVNRVAARHLVPEEVFFSRKIPLFRAER